MQLNSVQARLSVCPPHQCSVQNLDLFRSFHLISKTNNHNLLAPKAILRFVTSTNTHAPAGKRDDENRRSTQVSLSFRVEAACPSCVTFTKQRKSLRSTLCLGVNARNSVSTTSTATDPVVAHCDCKKAIFSGHLTVNQILSRVTRTTTPTAHNTRKDNTTNIFISLASPIFIRHVVPEQQQQQQQRQPLPASRKRWRWSPWKSKPRT